MKLKRGMKWRATHPSDLQIDRIRQFELDSLKMAKDDNWFVRDDAFNALAKLHTDADYRSRVGRGIITCIVPAQSRRL